jgi:hypothetical protein
MSESNNNILSGSTPKNHPLYSDDSSRKVVQDIIKSGIDCATTYDMEMFTGRISELAQIKTAFNSGKKVVVLYGTGGIGKTFLALKYAFDNRDTVNAHQVVILKDVIKNVLGQYTNIDYIEYIARYTKFTESVEDQIAQQMVHISAQNNESRSRLRAEKLKELSAGTLLIIDNYNDLNERGLNSIAELLKCKVILTTRKNINKKCAVAEYIHVKPPQDVDALKIFQNNSKLDEENFEPDLSEEDKNILQQIFQKYIGYHTMSIVILAKIHKVQKDTLGNEWTIKNLKTDMEQHGFASLESEVDSITKPGEDTQEYVPPLTILERLFDLSNIVDEKETEILHLMSLVSPNVSIAFNDINRLLSLNNNPGKLHKLSNSGWIVCESSTFRLEHVISEMFGRRVNPTKKSAVALIEWCIQQGKDVRYIIDNDSLNRANNITAHLHSLLRRFYKNNKKHLTNKEVESLENWIWQLADSLISILQTLGSQKEYMSAIEIALKDCQNNITPVGRSKEGVLLHIKAANTINCEERLSLERLALEALENAKSFGEAALIALFLLDNSYETFLNTDMRSNILKKMVMFAIEAKDDFLLFLIGSSSAVLSESERNYVFENIFEKNRSNYSPLTAAFFDYYSMYFKSQYAQILLESMTQIAKGETNSVPSGKLLEALVGSDDKEADNTAEISNSLIEKPVALHPDQVVKDSSNEVSNSFIENVGVIFTRILEKYAEAEIAGTLPKENSFVTAFCKLFFDIPDGFDEQSAMFYAMANAIDLVSKHIADKFDHIIPYSLIEAFNAMKSYIVSVDEKFLELSKPWLTVIVIDSATEVSIITEVKPIVNKDELNQLITTAQLCVQYRRFNELKLLVPKIESVATRFPAKSLEKPKIYRQIATICAEVPDCDWDTALKYYEESIKLERNNLGANTNLAFSGYLSLVRCALLVFQGTPEEKENFRTRALTNFSNSVDNNSDLINWASNWLAYHLSFDAVAVESVFVEDDFRLPEGEHFTDLTHQQILQGIMNSLVLRARIGKDAEVQTIFEKITTENMKPFQSEGINPVELYFYLLLRNRGSEFELLADLSGHIFAEMCDKGSTTMLIGATVIDFNKIINILLQSLTMQEVLEWITLDLIELKDHVDLTELSEAEQTAVRKKIMEEVSNNIQNSCGNEEDLSEFINVIKQNVSNYALFGILDKNVIKGAEQFLEVWPVLVANSFGDAYEKVLASINK